MASSNDRTSGQNEGAAPKDGGGVTEALQTAHDNRVEVDEPGLGKDDIVDARLDNRTGDDRPVRVDFPAVPQQVDGPDVAHQAEFTRRYLSQKAARKAADDKVLGQHSPGPHGLSGLDERKGHDRAGESGGKPAKDGETGSPVVGKPEAQGTQGR
jgi:hypothetical protein